jgi:hypothetical protein
MPDTQHLTPAFVPLTPETWHLTPALPSRSPSHQKILLSLKSFLDDSFLLL